MKAPGAAPSQRADVSTLTPRFAASLGVAYARPGHWRTGPCSRDDVFDPRDEDDAADLAWLDANAPGWALRVEVGQPVELHVDIGAEPVLDMDETERFVLFVHEGQRAAWAERREAAIRAHEAAWEAYRAAVAVAPEGAEVCHECAVLMDAYERVETERIGQFAFLVEARGHRCGACGTESRDMGDTEGFVSVMDDIASRVGLPDWGSPLFGDAVAAEWARRKQAPPEVTLEVALRESGASVLGRLDGALAAAGIPPRGGVPRPA